MQSSRSEDRIRARRLDLGRKPPTSDDARRRRCGETVRLRQDKLDQVMVKRRRDVTPEIGDGAEAEEVVTRKVRNVSPLPSNVNEYLFSTVVVVYH